MKAFADVNMFCLSVVRVLRNCPRLIIKKQRNNITERDRNNGQLIYNNIKEGVKECDRGRETKDSKGQRRKSEVESEL